MAGAGLAVLAVTAYVALRTVGGQLLDDAAMDAVTASGQAQQRLLRLLSTVSIGSVALGLLACVVVALARRQVRVAVAAALLVGGANLTTQVLKYSVLSRSPDVLDAPQSLPSGHTTVTLSLGMAAVLVAPPAWRRVIVPLAALAGTVVGPGTVVGRWHRPSDVIAAVGVCLVWTGLSLLVALVVRRSGGPAVAVVRRSLAGASWRPLLGAALAGLLFILWGVRPAAGLAGVPLALAALAVPGVLVALAVGWAAHAADRCLP